MISGDYRPMGTDRIYSRYRGCYRGFGFDETDENQLVVGNRGSSTGVGPCFNLTMPKHPPKNTWKTVHFVRQVAETIVDSQKEKNDSSQWARESQENIGQWGETIQSKQKKEEQNKKKKKKI